MNIQIQQASIFSLPPDLLEELFVAFVDCDEISPVLLSHVCRHWRDVARRSGRLWTRIDLGHPERAKHFVDLSQEAPLHVLWNSRSPRSYAALWVNKRDWMWERASRFAVLELAASSKVIQHVVSKMGNSLPMLVKMVVLCDDTSVQVAQWMPVPLACCMPQLRSLFLRYEFISDFSIRFTSYRTRLSFKQLQDSCGRPHVYPAVLPVARNLGTP